MDIGPESRGTSNSQSISQSHRYSDKFSKVVESSVQSHNLDYLSRTEKLHISSDFSELLNASCCTQFYVQWIVVMAILGTSK